MSEIKNDLFQNYFNFFINKLFFIIYCLLLSLNSINNQCEKETPILIGDACELKYCTELQYQNEECTIANKILDMSILLHIQMEIWS